MKTENQTNKQQKGTNVKFKAAKDIKLPGKYDDKGWKRIFKKGFKVKLNCPKCGYETTMKIKYNPSPAILLLGLTILLMGPAVAIYVSAKNNQQIAIKEMQESGTLHVKKAGGAICPKCKDEKLVYTIIELPDWEYEK